MGQKVNPISLRIGITKGWQSRWLFAPKGEKMAAGRYPYAKFLEEDEAVRNVIKKKIAQAGIAGIEIERTSNNVRVLIRAARPGFVIGQGGKGIEELAQAIDKALKKVRAARKDTKSKINLNLSVEELKRSDVAAAYMAQQIAWDLEKRFPFRRTMKKYIENAMQMREIKGIKIMLAGRLDGAEIARHESMRKGELPLQTLRTDVDYGTCTAFTTYGTVGIKIWIYRGESFGEAQKRMEPTTRNQMPHRGAPRQQMGGGRYNGQNEGPSRRR